MRIREPSVSEPLKRCRNYIDDVKTEVLSWSQDKHRGNLLTVCVTSGIKVAGIRSRLLCGTWEAVVPMIREKLKWRPHKSESTDAGHSGGPTRSSDKGSVMELERRGWIDQLYNLVNHLMGGAIE